MILTTVMHQQMRQQMRKAARSLMSGAASATLKKAFSGMPVGLATPVAPGQPVLRSMKPDIPNFGAADAMPDMVRNLLGQLGVADAIQGPAAVPIFRQPLPQANDTSAQENVSGNKSHFLSKSFTNQAGTREYKLFIPASYHGQPMPLVVMLHGCTQNPDDFANGTRMNLLAEEKQCFVVYPAQAQSANSSKCWNWFKALDQQRGQGEPGMIAGITCELIKNYHLDAERVYVAGLSAGGAMAVIMANTYPELYAAVGVHSGLPYACAVDLPSALAAMRGGPANSPLPASRTKDSCPSPIPIIIFHGASDTTVHKRNGEQLMEPGRRQNLTQVIKQGQVPGGHRYTCTTQHNNEGQLLAEHWLIHGAGHAWAGGSKSGSYTDPKGPDATREMLRFFYAQAKPTHQK